MIVLRSSVSLAITAAVATVGVLSSNAAHAQDYYSADISPRRKVIDPQFAAEIRFGPYHPDVDDGVPGTVPCAAGVQCSAQKPYDKVFGDDKRLMISAEIDWEAFHFDRWLTIGLGGLIGYTKASGTAEFADGSGGSAEPANLSIWVFGALGVLRLDGLANNADVPIAPYAKFGPAVGYWSSSNGRGVSDVGGVEGRGHTVGIVYAVGAALQLDWFDRQSAKSFNAERGVKHTYAFGEYTVMQLHGVGQTNAMWIGDKTWNVGLMFEF
jgi:hypothetical protein